MAEEEGYWDEHGQWIDGYGVYDEQGNYVYPDNGDVSWGNYVGETQPQSPGVGVDPSWYAGGEAFGDDATSGATYDESWEQMYDDSGNVYYFNHHTSDWQYEVPEGFIPQSASGPNEHGYWDEQGEYHWHEGTEGYFAGEGVEKDGGVNSAQDKTDFTDSNGWQAVDDGYGNIYYYNHYTGDSAWEAPESYTTELAMKAPADSKVSKDDEETSAQSQTSAKGAEANEAVGSRSNALSKDSSAAKNEDIIEPVSVSYKATNSEHKAATRIQSVHRGNQARHSAVEKRHRIKEIQNTHRSAIRGGNDIKTDTESESQAATRLQSMARRRNARRKLADMKMLAPVLSELQNTIDSKKVLFASPIENAEDLFKKIDKDGAGAVTFGQIFDALEQLGIGVEAPGQRRRLMQVLDVDRSGSVDLREFKRGLRIGNVEFHKQWKRGKVDTSDGKALTDTEKRMQEVRNRLHKVTTQDGSSSNSDQNVKGKIAPSTPGTMSISREDFLKQHSIKEELGLEHQYDEKATGISPTNLNTPKSSVLLGVPSPVVNEQVSENTGNRHLVTPKISQKRIEELQTKALMMQKALKTNPKDKVACAKYGYVLLEQGKYEEAISKLEQASSLGVDTARLWRSLGHAFFLTDRVDSSRSMFSKAERRHLSTEENRRKKFRATGETFEPRKVPLLMLYRWARTDMRRRNFKDAVDRLSSIVDQSPGQFDSFVQQQEVYISLGSCKYQLGCYAEALDWFQTAIMSRPGNRRKKNQNNASTTKRKKGKDTEENNSVSDKRLRSKRDSSRKGSRDKKQKDVDDKDKVNDEIAWKVGHLMKRAVQYIMARCYQQIGEPERGRVMLARAARRIPRRSITRLRQNNVGGSQGEKKLPTKSKNKKKSKTSTKIPQSVDFVSDDSGTSADELSADDDNLDSGTVDASNSADGTSNLLDPGLALKSKKGDLVAKFGAFWANRRHYELSIDMFRTALAADEHRQDWWTLLATCLKRQGKTADAVEAAERAHSLSSASGQGWKTMVSPFDTSNISSKMESWQKDREIYGDMIPSNPPSARSKSSKNRSRPSTAGSIRQPNNGVTKGPIQGLTNAQLEAAREENLKMEKRIIEEISRRMNETLSEKLDAFTKAVTPLKKRNNNNIHGKSGNFEYDEEEEESEVEAEEKEEEEFHQKKRKIRKRQSRHSDNDKKRSDLKETRQSLASGIENSIENSKKSWQSLSNSPKKSVRKKETVLSSVSLLSEEKQEAWIEEDSLTIDTQNPNDISDLASGAAYATAAAAASISSSSNAWASRSQNRLARVAQLAARATSALAEALRQASPSRTDENGFEKKDDSDNTIMPMFTPSQSLVMEDRMSEGQKPQGHPMEPTQTENLEVKDDIDPVPLPNITLNGIRDGSALRKDQNPVWREGRDFILIRRVFEEVSDTGNYKSGAVSKKAFLDALAKDFAVQEFIMGHPYNLIQPLLLRTQTFTPREGATVFEQTISMDTNERNIRWPDIEEQIRSLGGTTNAVGTAGHEVHDPYDPRFAYDGQRQRSQAEREERNATLQKKAELKQLRARQSEIDRKNREKDERIKQLSMSSLDTLGGYPGVDGVSILESTTDPRLQNSLMSQSSSLAYLDDNFVPVSAGGTLAQDSAYHNSVLPGDLDHELSWQYKGGDGRPPRPDETEEERRTRLEREEADFRRQRAAVEAELSVARTALAVRNLEAAQHIETVGRELKKRLEGKNGRSRTHELLNIRADAAAEISRLSADAKAIRNRVQEHIDKVDDILDIRRDSKANRRHNEAQAIAKMTLKNQKERRKRLKASRGEGDNSSSDSSSGEDTEDTSEALPGDGVMRLISRGGEAGSAAIFNASTSLAKSGHRNNSGKKKKKKDKKKGKRKNSDSNRRKKKIYVDSADPEMRMLFADYEHGTSVRQKIIQVRTVHKHISEEEAFLSLIECNSDVDKAIGKLTDVRFFRDLRTVSQLAKKAKPGEISYATATAMQKGSESRKQTKAVATDLPISKTGGETGSFAPAGRKELINTYDEWLKYRNAREATDENLMVQRVSFHNQKLSSLGDEKIEGLDVPQSHEEVTARDAAPSVNVSLTHSGSNLVSVLAKSSPYLVQPFRRKKPTRAQKRMFRKKSGHMADSFPAYIDGALKAETNWKKNGGMRRRLHGGGAAVRDVTKGKKRKHGAQGSGARAATALKSEHLKRQRVSKVGAFEGVNPTIDNPTPEYRAVQFAMREVLPIPANSLAYKSDYRQIPRGGEGVNPDELDQLTQLA